jgi:hypothetical protein
MATSFDLPDTPAALAQMRALQSRSGGGLSSLMDQDTGAQRARVQRALYDASAEGINTAADRQRQTMLEGTFAHGVGPSSITVELAGRGQQEQGDALARAARDAYAGAGAEQRADLASQQGLYNTGFAAATAGLQGDANVALTNAAREQQESQFGRNLEFQGSENAANRSQQESQFGRNLGLSYDQLGQQESQFGRNLAFQGSENAANRAFTGSENAANRAFTGGENAANRNLTSSEAALNRLFQGSESAAGRAFTGGENQANRALQQYLQESGQGFTAAQNQANRALTQTEGQNARAFAGSESQAARDLQRYLNESGQAFTGTQNQATRDATMAQLLLQIANSQGIAAGNQAGALGGAAAGGVGALLGPLLAMLLGGRSE